MAEESKDLTLFGRTDVVRRLAASGAPLTVLSGDSGLGKSEVLRAAQILTQDAIAPEPRTLPSSGGVLQRVLLDGLGAVLAENIRLCGRTEELGRFLGEAAERVIASGGQELVRVVGKEVLAVIRGRLGADVGEAVTAYTSSLKDSVDDRLAVRLDTAVDRMAVELVLALANDVLGQLEQGAVLALDAGERLSPEDVRVLGDVVAGLPVALRIRIAVSTYSGEHQAIVERLVGANANVAEIKLAGIEEAGVCEWLEAERLPANMAAEATRVTGGYALHLGDLMAHLRAGGAIDDAPLHEVFARRTEEAWVQLLPEIARHARRLCVFADPLPQEHTLELLGLDAAAWGEAQERLRRARIFSVEVNGTPWFHEQRRRYLSEVKLDDSERASACTDAVAMLRALTEETQRVDRLAEFAGLMRFATPLLGEQRVIAVRAWFGPSAAGALRVLCGADRADDALPNARRQCAPASRQTGLQPRRRSCRSVSGAGPHAVGVRRGQQREDTCCTSFQRSIGGVPDHWSKPTRARSDAHTASSKRRLSDRDTTASRISSRSWLRDWAHENVRPRRERCRAASAVERTCLDKRP